MSEKRYITLHKGQLVKPGDQYFSDSCNEWCETLNANGRFHVGDLSSKLKYRRPLKSKVAAKTSLNKRKPKRSGKAGGRTASAVR